MYINYKNAHFMILFIYMIFPGLIKKKYIYGFTGNHPGCIVFST